MYKNGDDDGGWGMGQTGRQCNRDVQKRRKNNTRTGQVHGRSEQRPESLALLGGVTMFRKEVLVVEPKRVVVFAVRVDEGNSDGDGRT